MKFELKLISIIIAFILIVGFLFVFPDVDKSEDELETNFDQQQEEQTTLFWSEADFNEIHLVNDRKNQEVILEKNGKGNWDTTHPLPEKVNLNKLDQAVSIIFSLSGHSKEAKLSVDDVFTGEEERSITLLNQSGIKEKLTIGNKNDDDTFYYVKLLESDEIYQVAVQLIDALPFTQEDLFDRSIIQITSEQVRKIKIDNGTETIELAPESPYSEEEIKSNVSGWYMHEPYHHVFSVNYNRMSEMIYGIKDIEWIERVDDPENDLQHYGLADANFKMTFSSDNKEETILIGAPATAQSFYAKLVDEDKIFTVANRALLPYSFQAFDLVDKSVKKIAWDVLKQLRIETENESVLLTIDQINFDENESEFNHLFKINDHEIEEDIFIEIYELITELSVDQAVDDAAYQTPEITMTYTIIDNVTSEKVIRVEFVPYDQENYAVFVEQKADFLIEKEKLSHMMEIIKTYVE